MQVIKPVVVLGLLISSLLAHAEDRGKAYVSNQEGGVSVINLNTMETEGSIDIQAKNEMVFRFELPEKPGALMKFLETMGHNWNISLFHYRNHGADFGRVLVGIQVPPEDEINFEVFLNQLGYPFWDETDNPAYKLFLG